MAWFYRPCCLLFFLGRLLGFLIAHECDHSFGSLLPSKLIFWAIIFCPYDPPWKPASVLFLCSGNGAADGNQSCRGTTPISYLLASGDPPVKKWQGSIIRRCCANSSRRRERPQYLVSTLLWPLAVRLSSSPKRLGGRATAPPWRRKDPPVLHW